MVIGYTLCPECFRRYDEAEPDEQVRFLIALDRDYLDIGNQCGEVAGKILGGTSPSAVSPASPRKVTYSINLKTAGAMNLELPQEIVRGATNIVQ